jgi:hypothetical protein
MPGGGFDAGNSVAIAHNNQQINPVNAMNPMNPMNAIAKMAKDITVVIHGQNYRFRISIGIIIGKNNHTHPVLTAP